jgi:lysophospholipase L1-like esterase
VGHVFTRIQSVKRLNTDVVAFNSAAKAIMDAANIPVVDVYGLVVGHCGEGYLDCDWQQSRGVHFTGLGYNNLAKAVYTELRKLAGGL